MSLDALKFVIEEEAAPRTKIRVLGVGGGGSNAVARMLGEGLGGVEFFILNTDLQALAASPVTTQLAIGAKITRGLGAGSDPAVGRQAALEDTEKIIELLEGADMVFVTAGLGGGTGTGAVPVVASLAKELGALTVAVVTKPFGFEGPKRMRQAEAGLAELASVADTVITIPNDQLLRLAPKGTSFFEAFRIADDVLRQAVQGISDIITTPGLINRDFSDIRAIMLGMGYAMMGTAEASGENAAVTAAEKAISCPLLEAGGVRGARGVLINITGSSQLGLHEVNEACSLISSATENPDVQINFGVVLDEHLADKVKLTVIATGFERETLPAIQRKRQAAASAGALRAETVPQPAPEAEPTVAVAPAEPAVAAAMAEKEEEGTHSNGLAGPEAPREPLIPDPFKDIETPAILRRRMVQ
ncbi:MAG TPA: cell division protein FtsZ [Bryobacteraceae bacterium]|nr:cell division protein FtsZ [Bryobacteraceae bacterium]